MYEIYVVTFWLRSAQAHDPECEAGWILSEGRKMFPRLDFYVNSVDDECAWYEPPPKGEDKM